MKLSVDERQFATILAALRFWQRKGVFSFAPEHDIAIDGGKHDLMEPHEIDALCYRLNTTTARDDRTLAIIELARERHSEAGICEIDDDALLSEGDDNGTYVQAWVWVDFFGTPFDKEAEEENEDG